MINKLKLFVCFFLTLLFIQIGNAQNQLLRLEISKATNEKELVVVACFCNLSEENLYLNNIASLQRLTAKGYQVGFIFQKNDSLYAPKFKSSMDYKATDLTTLGPKSKHCVNFRMNSIFKDLQHNSFITMYYKNEELVVDDKNAWTGYITSNALPIK
jgi:hypothetical protein